MKPAGWLGRAVSLLFPTRCVCCGRLAPAGVPVCETCAHSLPRVTGEICPKCGRGREWCACRGKKRAYERCVAPLYYEGMARKGVLRMKYGNHPAAAAGFAVMARETVEREYAAVPFDMVTAVPMTAAEQRARGFNQAALFGRQLARGLSLPYRETLRKAFVTKPQHMCAACERQGNVFGAYAALPGKAGRTVLLVDDIVTTGATLNECAKVLCLAGAERVYCVAIACVRRKNAVSAEASCKKTEFSG